MQKRLTEEEVMSIPRLVDEGRGLKHVAETLGVTVRTVSTWINQLRAKGHTIKIKRGAKPILK